MPPSQVNGILIASAARTPIGKFGGTLSRTSATTLGAIAISAAVEKSGLDATDIGYVFMGNMLAAGLGQTPARQAAIKAGIPQTTSATTINKACASGLQSAVLGAQMIQLGETQAVIAGGMENMSSAPHLLMNSRTGQRLGNTKLIDHMIHDGLWCPFENRHMGGSAEAIADAYDIQRTEMDEYALRSNQLASSSVEEGWFDTEIVSVEVRNKHRDQITLSRDEGPRADTSLQGLRKLSPAFPPGDRVTAGNAAQISDGAAALVLLSEEMAIQRDVAPLGRVVGYAHSANDPSMLFDAPRVAVKKLLERTDEKLGDFDLIEVNEAFAAQVLANEKALNWDRSIVNSHGGAIALGHPIGASGARILTSLLYALKQSGGRRGLAAICHAGGGAVAMSVEAV